MDTNKELPNSSFGQSAFTMFGYGRNRYDVDPLDSPVDIAPESFDATNSIVVRSRPTKKDSNSTEGSSNSRKLRVSGLEGQHLVLQSLASTAEPPISDRATMGQAKGPHDLSSMSLLSQTTNNTTSFSNARQSAKLSRSLHTRRYSSSQSNDDTPAAEVTGFSSHTDHLLQMFSATQSSSPPQPAALTQDTQSSPPTTTASSQGRGLIRQGSSPVLSSLMYRSGSISHKNKSLSRQSNITGDGLTHSASSSALSSLADHDNETQSQLLNTNDVTPLTSQSTSPHNSELAVRDSNPPAKSSPISSSVTPPPHADGSSVDKPEPHSGGFGVLARTRKFGAWLGSFTQGDKIEVTKKDMNVFAPTSF